MLKSKKGISLTTTVITVMVLLVIMGALSYSALDSVKIRKLNKLYDDLRQIDDAVGIYYLKHGELPAAVDASGAIRTIKCDKGHSVPNEISFVLKSGSTLSNEKSLINPNDYGDDSIIYEYINLELLDNISLNYPDEYIVNVKSHTIYHLEGIKLDGKVYHSLPLKYRDVKYSENNPVTSLSLKAVDGIAIPSSDNRVYFAMDYSKVGSNDTYTGTINLKDLLSFNADGSGKPKTVTFTESATLPTNLKLDSITGIMSAANFTNISPNDININVAVSNYKTSYGNKSITLKLGLTAINVADNSNNHIEKVNLLVDPKSSICKEKKTNATYKVIGRGALNTVPDFGASTKSENSDIAKGQFNRSVGGSANSFVLSSGTSAGSANVVVETDSYGKAKDSVKVNTYSYKVYAGSAGSNTDITKLEFTSLGDSAKKNVILNVEGPEEGTKTIEWSIANSTVAKADITGNTVKITPLKFGTTTLNCVFKIDGEQLAKLEIPVVVSGIQQKINTSEFKAVSGGNIDVSISTIKNSGINLKYQFGESVTNPVYSVKVNPSTDFVVTEGADKVFNIKYKGSSSELVTTVEFVITAKVGDKEQKFEDSVKLTIK